MMETLDGDYQAMKANDGAFVRKHFFGRVPRDAGSWSST
jgi:pyruvate dehydrogenase E1 component